MHQQFALALGTQTVAAEIAVAANHPVAGHDQRHRVGAAGRPGRAEGARVAGPLRQMGATFDLTRDEVAPLTVRGGKLKAIFSFRGRRLGAAEYEKLRETQREKSGLG